jgi:hypothetical protein
MRSRQTKANGGNLRPREGYDEAKQDGGQDRSQGGSQCSALSKNGTVQYKYCPRTSAKGCGGDGSTGILYCTVMYSTVLSVYLC